MKPIVVLLIIGLFLQVSGIAQEGNAAAYLQNFSKISVAIGQKYISYVSASSHGKSTKKIDKSRQQLVTEISEASAKVNMLPFYKGDKKIWEASKEYYILLNKVFNDNFTSIVDMEEIAEQSYDAMETYMLAKEVAEQKLADAQRKLEEAEKAFAQENNIAIADSTSTVQSKVKKIRAVNKYHKQLYLLFFRCHKQDEYIQNAIRILDVNALEQNTSSLLSFAKDGLVKLAAINAYDNDSSLIQTVKSSLMYYWNLAESIVPIITAHILKKEAFAKLQKEISDRGGAGTSDNIKEFNTQVDDLNKSVAIYNNLMRDIAITKNNKLNNWSNAEVAFFHKHMPYSN
jgi:hypothetical protein